MIKKRSSSNVMPNTLGELELAILQSLWDGPSLDAKRLCQHSPVLRKLSLSTVQSTLERLYRKGLVARDKQGHAFQYRALVSRSDLLGRMMGDVIQLLHDGKLETILSSFVNVAADMDEASLSELEALINKKKKNLETGL